MTHAIFYVGNNGKYKGFRVIGHANYAEHGKDIVCAAISAVTQAIVIGISEVVGASSKVTIDKEKGLIEVDVSESDYELIEKVDTLIETMQISLAHIETQYSEYLTVENVYVA